MNDESESRDLHISLADGVLRDTTDDFELLPGELSRQQLLIATLYASLVEMTCDGIVLLGQPTAASVGHIVRIALETYADLSALLVDDHCADRLQTTFYKEKLRLIKGVVKRADSPFNADIAANVDIPAERVSVKNAPASHQARGHKQLKSPERFAALKPGEHYGALYWQLCLQSHRNVAALQQRQFMTTSGRLALELFKPIESTTVLQYLDALASVVIHASIELHRFMKTGADTKYDAYLRDLNQLRETLAEVGVSKPTRG